MKLTKADFRCSFFDESCDLDQDVIDQCLRDQKLRELIEKRIELLSQLIEKKKEQNEPHKWVSDMIDILQKLLEESKKN